MTDTTRAPLRNLIATINTVEQKTNTNQKHYVVARATLANGTQRTLMTYKRDMMALLLDGGVGVTHRLFGSFEGKVFSPIGLSRPREGQAN